MAVVPFLSFRNPIAAEFNSHIKRLILPTSGVVGIYRSLLTLRDYLLYSARRKPQL